MTSLKTPLRYPGGKSRAVKKMAQFFPLFSDYKEFREPFLGGGSVALYITQTHPHLDVWVNDLYEPLYTFWTQLQSNGKEIRNELIQLKQRHPDPTSVPLPIATTVTQLRNPPLQPIDVNDLDPSPSVNRV